MKKLFNLIEIALAIGVIGIGMTAIMALFPVGFSATRQAIAQNYATDAADQFLTYIVRYCNDRTVIVAGPPKEYFWDYFIYSDSGTPTNTGDDTQGLLLAEPAEAPQPSFWSQNWNTTDSAAKTAEATLTTLMEDTTNIFQSTAPATYPGLFRITQGSTIVTDFEGIARVWRAPVTGVWIYEQNLDINYAYSARLYMELSWPAQKPYSKREKKTFCIEVFRQKF